MANTDAPTGAQTALLPVPASSPAALAHVADHQHRYPGESVRLFTRIDLHQASADLQVHVGLPEGLALVEQKPLAAPGGVAPHLAVGNDNRSLVWMLRGPIPAGSRFEFETQARVQPVAANTRLTSLATVVAADGYPLVEEALTLRVWAQGRYLRHLPELYARDEFMARFLMLFESFWAPLETQIDAMDYYLAPGTTPERLLPWLASWVGLALDARLPRDRQRALVRAAIWLHRRRGTRQALQQYLEIASGGAVEIVEHRAADFCLGPDNRLGPGVALGRGNRPHTFTVVVDLPDQDGDGREQRQLLESIVEAEKPAHTDYELIMGSTEKE